jgi:hypothetical protein
VQFRFWACLSPRKDLHWTSKSTGNLNTPAVNPISNEIAHHTWREELCRVCTTEPLPYARHNKTARLEHTAYVRALCEKFKAIANSYSITTVFKTRRSLTNTLAINRPVRAPQETENCVCNTAWECGRSYIGQESTPLAVRHGEHRRNLEEGHLQRYRIVQHGFEEDHGTVCNLAATSQIERKSLYRNHEEAAHISCLKDPITQPSREICQFGFLRLVRNWFNFLPHWRLTTSNLVTTGTHSVLVCEFCVVFMECSLWVQGPTYGF